MIIVSHKVLFCCVADVDKCAASLVQLLLISVTHHGCTHSEHVQNQDSVVSAMLLLIAFFTLSANRLTGTWVQDPIRLQPPMSLSCTEMTGSFSLSLRVLWSE